MYKVSIFTVLQVTDRQMIWTSIEIVIIIFILLFLHFRRNRVTLPPEVKTLIDSMPTQPTGLLPQRRNSLPGPATPSKERTFRDLHSAGGLHRFSSETALGVHASCFLTVTSFRLENLFLASTKTLGNLWNER